MLHSRFQLAVAACAALQGSAAAEAPRKIAELELSLLGVSASVDPAEPTVPKNTASAVRVIVRAGPNELSAADVARFVGAGFQVEAELSGPGLRGTVTLPQSGAGQPPPGDPLLLGLPPLSVAGDYTLSHVRIVAGGRTLLDAAPSLVTVKVIDQILVTSVKTRPLTLDEIRDRGIVLDSKDYIGFEFTLGMKTSSQSVSFSLPVVFDRKGVAVPQVITPPPSPPRAGINVSIDQPEPLIIPTMLKVDTPPDVIDIPAFEKSTRLPS